MSEYRTSTKVAAVVATRSRAGDWLRRYGIAELAGIATAMLGAWLADALHAHLVILAYAATIGENVGFYGTILARQVAHDRSRAAALGDRYGARRAFDTGRDLLLEFGPAELLDSLVIRPLAMGLGVHWFGHQAGVVAGKLAADVAFYVPVILTYEMRRAREQRAER